MTKNISQAVNKGVNRRSFLRLSSSLAVAGAASNLVSQSAIADDFDDFDEHLSERKFWQKVRQEFVLSRRETYMNVGTTGSIPERVLENYEDNNEYISKHPWASQVSTIELSQQMASSFGADPHELVFNRNTTDGVCSLLHGLQFESGDVILTTNHEHFAVTTPLKVISERYQLEVVELVLPAFTGSESISEDDFVTIFAEAIEQYGDRVKLLCFSHITYTTGICLPAKRICKEVAIPNGIPTLVDGAHASGMLDLDFHDIDCDFYTASGHKWQCGPGCTGILYVKDNAKRLKEFWYDRPNPLWMVNSSYPGNDLHAQLQYVGQDNYPAKQALVECCQLWDRIGRKRIERRVLKLSKLCKHELNQVFTNASLYAPDVAELSSGLTTFNPFYDKYDGELLTLFRDRLREEYGYIIRTTSFYLSPNDNHKTHALRISTHLFHNEKDVKGLVAAMKELYLDMT